MFVLQEQRKSQKLKWCFLMNQVYYLFEFLGKFSHQVIEEGDGCIVIANSKIAELSKGQYFPKNIKIFSEVDWLIKNYEKNQNEFGDLSWKEFFPTFDRKIKSGSFKFNYKNSVEIISQLYQFIGFVLQKEKPDVVIGEAPANLFTEIAYHLCRKYNIIYLGFMGSRVNKRIDIYDLEHTCSKYKEAFREIKETDISEDEKRFTVDFIENSVSHKQLSPYVEYQIRNIQLGEINRIKRFIKEEKKMFSFWMKYILRRKEFKLFDYESKAVFKWNFFRPLSALKRKFRILSQKNIFGRLDNNDKFFIYPLHVQPEASTSVLATYFCDQLSTIKNIAFSLPFPYKLYVKEHPAGVGSKPGHFYKKIKELPNVVLIPPYENAENLIKKSQGIITLSSTVGMEAALAGKPVYVLGNVFYSYHPMCREVKGFEDLKEKIKEDLNRDFSIKNLQDTNIKFVVSYYRNTIPGEIISASNKNDTNDYDMIYREIKRIFLAKRGKPLL